MRIAFLMERLDPARGGAETCVSDFTARLATEGHDVHVFSRRESVPPAGVTLHPVRVRGVGRAMRTLSFARNVEKMLARHTHGGPASQRFDIVQGTAWTWTQDVFQPHNGVYRAMLAAKLRRHRGMRAFGERLGQQIGPKQMVFRWIEQVQYVRRPAVLFVALSRMVQQDMERCYGLAAAKIELVYNGVDTRRFHPRNREVHRAAVRQRCGIGGDEVVFLIVAQDFERKGVRETVECVTRKLPPCRLFVVGRGRVEKFRGLAEGCAPGRVIFTGAVADTAPYYAAADACVLPTNYDPCSLVVLEALASGLPVITSTMNGAGELMTHGREGWIIGSSRDRSFVAAEHVTELADVMHRLFEPTLRKKMGDTARVLAEKHTLHHNYQQMMAVYEKVLRRKKPT
jgi:UDP-glucose:(heptosyl)LPS alpha-1,3-glucosyltransferase